MFGNVHVQIMRIQANVISLENHYCHKAKLKKKLPVMVFADFNCNLYITRGQHRSRSFLI